MAIILLDISLIWQHRYELLEQFAINTVLLFWPLCLTDQDHDLSPSQYFRIQ